MSVNCLRLVTAWATESWQRRARSHSSVSSLTWCVFMRAEW